MIHLGLIGYPLEYSLSPKIHSAALNAFGLEGNYSLFPIRPDDKQSLRNLLARVCGKEIAGLNVTIPHKQDVIQLLDELTPTAKVIGAVNTIYLKEDKLIGDNTDALGFLIDLNRLIYNQKSKIENHKSAIVLGAGGAARAVVYALITDGWNVAVVARRIEQTKSLAGSFKNMNITDNISNINLLNTSLIVNATSIGMMPNIDQSPLPEKTQLHQDVFVYDLVYNPTVTKLVNDVRAQGLNATTGLGMLIEQAALSFQIWTNYDPPRDILFDAVK